METRIFVDGVLGFADQRGVFNHLRGTVTGAPSPGALVKPGQRLYSVDQQPVFLLNGATPAWRSLSPGIEPGIDVSQLQRNLIALGLEVEVSGRFDAATEEAVRSWQERVGLAPTGGLSFGTIVFQPGIRRIASSPATGSPISPGAIVERTTSTARDVVISVSPEQRQLLHVGAGVEVSVPGTGVVHGTIAAIGRSASAHSDGPPTIGVSIRVPERAVPDLDAAPVSVAIVAEQAHNATSVSIDALLALHGGGFGVEVIDHGNRRIVPVTLGPAADGFVRISGRGIRPGTRVVTADA